MIIYKCGFKQITLLAVLLFLITGLCTGVAPLARAEEQAGNDNAVTGEHLLEEAYNSERHIESRGQRINTAGKSSSAGIHTGSHYQASKLSIDVRGVDMRDVLTALAINMGADIILLESPGEVTFQVSNIYPLDAFELLLQKEGLSYIKDGNIYIVGQVDDLETDFFNRMVLTRFDLSHISASAMEEVLNELSIPLESITFEENQQSIWIQAVPFSLTKVRQVIAQVDRQENIDPEVYVSLSRYDLDFISAERLDSIAAELEIPIQTIVLEDNPHIIWAHGTHQDRLKLEDLIRDVDIPENMEEAEDFTGYNLNHISAEKLDDIINEIGLSIHTVVVEENPYTLWVHGTSAAKEELDRLIAVVDIPDNEEMVHPLNRFDLQHVSAEDLRGMTDELDIPVQIIAMEESNPRVFWVQGPSRAVDKMRELVDAVDGFENADENYSIFVYQLENTVARDIEERLAAFGFGGIETVTFNFSEFGQEILIVSPPHLEDYVYSAITKLDEERQTVRIPVASADGTNARNSLLAQREVLSELTGIPVSRMNVSINLSGDSTEPYHLLWVEDTPDNVQKVVEMVEMIDEIDSP